MCPHSALPELDRSHPSPLQARGELCKKEETAASGLSRDVRLDTRVKSCSQKPRAKRSSFKEDALRSPAAVSVLVPLTCETASHYPFLISVSHGHFLKPFPCNFKQVHFKGAGEIGSTSIGTPRSSPSRRSSSCEPTAAAQSPPPSQHRELLISLAPLLGRKARCSDVVAGPRCATAPREPSPRRPTTTGLSSKRDPTSLLLNIHFSPRREFFRLVQGNYKGF